MEGYIALITEEGIEVVDITTCPNDTMLKALYFLINCTTVEQIRLPNGCNLICDENGIYSTSQFVHRIKVDSLGDVDLVGNLVIVNSVEDEDGISWCTFDTPNEALQSVDLLGKREMYRRRTISK